MTVGAIVVCRYGSTRFPGKILKKIEGLSILENILTRLRQISTIDKIIIATSDHISDDPIVERCSQLGMPFFRGSLDNVSERILQTAIHFDVDYFLRINGDNVLIDIESMQAMISIAKEQEMDFVSNVPGRSFPYGMSIEIIRTSFYQDIYSSFTTSDDFEHVTKWIYDNPSIGQRAIYKNTTHPELIGKRLALDTPQDYYYTKELTSYFSGFPKNYTLSEIQNAMKKLKNKTWFGKHGPLLIAEIGGNHEGDFEYAKRLTELAIASDVDYIKYQIYTGDTLVNPIENPVRNKHFKKFELSKENYLELAEMCATAGIGFMASVWNPQFASWIDKYSPIYKIGSGDFTAFPVLEEFVKLGKPLLLSTGLASEEEIAQTLDFIYSIDSNYKDPEMLAILQCTSMYPIPPEGANLGVMEKFKSRFNLPVGYSDHTEGMYALEIAVAMGAEILEFHFTDSREGKEFRDHKVSLTCDEVQELIGKIKIINQLKGDGVKRCLEVEREHLVSFRRGVYLNRNVEVGEKIMEKDLVSLRPNHGIDARDFRKLIGATALKNISQFEKLDEKYFRLNN